MSARLFWKQQFPLLLVHLLSMAALACFLALNGNNRDSILLILLTLLLMKLYSRVGKMEDMV